MSDEDKHAGREPQSAGRLWESWIDDQGVLRRSALRMTRGDREEAEDLLSATLVKAVAHVQRHDDPIREPRAFLLFAMKNEHISHLRRLRSERQVRDFGADIYQDTSKVSASETANQETLLWQQDLLELVDTVISHQPETMRRVFELRFVEEHSYRTIAEELGISEPLARKRVQHVRQVLRQALDITQTPEVAPPSRSGT